MNTNIVPATASPFDAIMRTDDYGNEYWSARDLAPLMGYSAWRNFETPLTRAMTAANNQGHDVESNFAQSRKVAVVGKMPQTDFHLSRFAAYHVAMYGYPNKREVADAQAYFAIQTRVAETQVQAVPSGPELLALAVVEAQKVIAAKDTEIAELTPKADAWNDLVSSAGSLSFRDAAKVISEEGGVTIGGVRLIEKLMDWGWCFRPATTPEEVAKGKTRSIRAYQAQIDRGTLTEKARQYTDQVTGEKKLSNNPQTRVTGKGLDRIRARLLAEVAA